MNKYYVYAHISFLGEIFYIGKGQGKRAYSNSKRTEAWKSYSKKYGNKVIFLKQNLTEKDALLLEKFYISLYGRKDLKEGILLNFTDGGEHPTRIINRKRIPIYQYAKNGTFIRKFESVLEASKFLNISDETVRACINKPNKSAGGFIFNKSLITNYVFIKNISNYKQIYQYNINGDYIKGFDSITICSNELGICQPLISACCRNIINHTKGFRFSYKKQASLGRLIKKKNLCKHLKKPIIAINRFTRKEYFFTSMKSASKKLSINFRQISKCCNNKKPQCKGYVFRFKNILNDNSQNHLEGKIQLDEERHQL